MRTRLLIYNISNKYALITSLWLINPSPHAKSDFCVFFALRVVFPK